MIRLWLALAHVALVSSTMCSTARLLVVHVAPDSFEGLGSVLCTVAETLAEAVHSNRLAIWGPPSARPPIFTGRDFDDYFLPLSNCSWEDVSPSERAGLFRAGALDRVLMASAYRGGPALFGGEVSAFEHATRVFRPKPWLEQHLRAIRDTIGTLKKPTLGIHLRASDTRMEAAEYGGRVYTNKPLIHPTDFKTLAGPFRSFYLATDDPLAQVSLSELENAFGVKGTLLRRFRTPHGSHTAGFVDVVPVATVPWEAHSRYVSTAATREAVRLEALEDLFALSLCDAFAGAASSHFSVFARLLAGLRIKSVTWVDLEGVSTGTLANGFFHGQLNTTFALHRPEERMRAVVERLIEWPPSPSDPPIRIGPDLPLVPRPLLRRLSQRWRGHVTETFCDTLSRTDELINTGVDFHERKNWELAHRCWERASAVGGEHAEVALSNLEALAKERRHELRRYQV